MENNMICLNVGGMKFMTSLSTLQSCPSSTLSLMFSPSSPHQLPARDSSGAYFLDSSPAFFGYILDWCRYKQLLVDRDNMDWSGLEVVADYFGMEEMRQEIRRRKEQDIEKKRVLGREKEDRHRELMETLAWLREDVAQLAQTFSRGHPEPGPPRFPNYPDPDFPFPGPPYL
eukprot:GFUD01020032.1.p1 GENE.GFUD01020032.1~~GFUD01020032.1.p1  ORF type:complete len:172 (+),score=76.38 GFUD01020032.1:89-604(+)